MLEIIPGILEKDWGEIEKKIKQVLLFAKTIQIDIIDGKFAPNTTFLDPTPFKPYSEKTLFEVQMMVDDPLEYIRPYALAGFRRFIGHIEKMPSQKDFLDTAGKFGEAGLALDINTPLSEIKVDFNSPDCFTLLSVRAGFSGQDFMPEVLKKIEELRKKTEKPIEVDGGVNEGTIRKLKSLGVNRCAVTSSLFKNGDILKAYQSLQNLAS